MEIQMLVGGFYLVAGTVLHIAPGDYLDGERPVDLIVRHVVRLHHERIQWVIVDGQEKVYDGPWRDCRVQLKVAAVKRSLTAGACILA